MFKITPQPNSAVSLWQIHTQAANNQKDVSKINSQWAKSVLRGEHDKDVEDVASSTDGKRLASVSNDRNVILWKVKEK